MRVKGLLIFPLVIFLAVACGGSGGGGADSPVPLPEVIKTPEVVLEEGLNPDGTLSEGGTELEFTLDYDYEVTLIEVRDRETGDLIYTYEPTEGETPGEISFVVDLKDFDGEVDFEISSTTPDESVTTLVYEQYFKLYDISGDLATLNSSPSPSNLMEIALYLPHLMECIQLT